MGRMIWVWFSCNMAGLQLQGKLDSEQREQLITKGHHLKEKLAVLEQRLNQVP